MGEMAIDALNSGTWYPDNDAEDEEGGAAPDNRGGPILRGAYQLQNNIHDHGQWHGGNQPLNMPMLNGDHKADGKAGEWTRLATKSTVC